MPLLGQEQLDSSLQINTPCRGGARHLGSGPVVAEVAIWARRTSIFPITAGYSILAMILTSPPHFSQILISILNTHFNRFAN
jgi:hypothetical protein